MSEPQPEAQPQEGTVQASAFEGMFRRALKPEGKFLEDLVSVGFDPRKLQPVYPARVWRDALDVARRHVHPELSPEQAGRALGAQFIQGFFDTIVGGMIAAGLPFLGVDALLRRLPKFWSMTRTGIEIVATPEAEKDWTVRFREKYPAPDFIAGLLETAFTKSKKPVTVEILEREPHSFLLRVRW